MTTWIIAGVSFVLGAVFGVLATRHPVKLKVAAVEIEASTLKEAKALWLEARDLFYRQLQSQENQQKEEEEAFGKPLAAARPRSKAN